MTTYEALMKTADHIEQHPHLYSFNSAHMSPHPVARLCILGRLGQIMGIGGFHADSVAPIALKMEASAFFSHMLELMPRFSGDLHNHTHVVPALRAFAQSYRTQVIPQEIREIFNPSQVKEPA